MSQLIRVNFYGKHHSQHSVLSAEALTAALERMVRRPTLLSQVLFTLWCTIVVVMCFGVPLYLLAIFPDPVPLPPWRAGPSMRGLALQNFWYRLAFCGGVIALGVLLLLSMAKSFSHRLRN